MTVGELVAEVDVGQPTVSHHLRVLADTGFVHFEPRANTSLYWVNHRCIEGFPSAAELIMGKLPQYGSRDADCRAPWQRDEAPSEPRAGSTRKVRARA